jgi:hypothetical protein
MLLALVAISLSPLVAPPAAADPSCPSDQPCDPDPSQFDCFQPVKGTLTCVLRIVNDRLP